MNIATLALTLCMSGRNGAIVWRRGLTALIVPLVAVSAQAATFRYDLPRDWSDANNPNGPWSCNEGDNVLPRVESWQREFEGNPWPNAQPGWAKNETNNTRIPVWLKSKVTPTDLNSRWHEGDVVVHTTDGANGISNGPANVTWTAPANGFISIEGYTWNAATNVESELRTNKWALTLDRTNLATGVTSLGNVTNTFTASNDLRQIAVCSGSRVKLQIEAVSLHGTWSGVNLRIRFTESVVPISIERSAEGKDALVRWGTEIGLIYQLQCASAVTGPWTDRGGPIAGTGEEACQNVQQDPPARFFVVRCSRPGTNTARERF